MWFQQVQQVLGGFMWFSAGFSRLLGVCLRLFRGFMFFLFFLIIFINRRFREVLGMFCDL